VAAQAGALGEEVSTEPGAIQSRWPVSASPVLSFFPLLNRTRLGGPYQWDDGGFEGGFSVWGFRG
jgi:hypothetical protein